MAVGCSQGGSSTAAGVVEYKKLRAMSILYSEYLGEHRDQAPADEKSFRAYLETKQDQLTQSNLTVDEMFKSPRGGALTWVYGRTPPTGPLGTYLGYEQSPVDGKRLVIANLGMYEEVDEAKFRNIFPNAR